VHSVCCLGYLTKVKARHHTEQHDLYKAITDRLIMDFSFFTGTIGRGPKLSRPLTRLEAAEAMRMILAGVVEPIQLGGFLLVLRQRGETAPELAGFVDAVRTRLDMPLSSVTPDIDWPSYADHHRQQPWFVLVPVLLAANGIKVLMHGISGTLDGCAPTRPALEALGIRPSRSLAEASTRLAAGNFAYVGLEDIAPEVERLFHLKPLLGVRSVANTFIRDLNPLGANLSLVGIVHAAYRPLHQEALGLLGQSNAAVFKGIGGEAHRNPFKSVQIATLIDGAHGLEDWPATLSGDAYVWRDEDLTPARIAALWQGEIAHPAAEASITATTAIALKLMGRAKTRTEAINLAQSMWHARNRHQALTG
tara:strand:+ start:2015 stop:3106 length:1092 start_codon:yes stop_codon:yes gene_type:complete